MVWGTFHATLLHLKYKYSSTPRYLHQGNGTRQIEEYTRKLFVLAGLAGLECFGPDIPNCGYGLYDSWFFLSFGGVFLPVGRISPPLIIFISRHFFSRSFGISRRSFLLYLVLPVLAPFVSRPRSHSLPHPLSLVVRRPSYPIPRRPSFPVPVLVKP